MFLLFLHLLCGFSFWEHPDSVDVAISNQLNTRSIASVSCILPNSDHLSTIHLPHPLLPESTTVVRVPYGIINKLVFETDDHVVYSLSGYPASTNPDTISVSLANKEFGGLFERIYGIYPILIQNLTDVNIYDIRIHGGSVPESNMLHNNILLPGEVLRVWIDSGNTVQVSALDRDGNASQPVSGTALTISNLCKITSDLFYNNGKEIGYNASVSGSWVVNSVTLDKMIKVEAFSPDGCFLDGLDCSASPITTWDRVYIRHSEPIGFVVLTDENNRTYTTSEPDSLSGYFVLGDFNLDFGYGFPE